MKYLVLFWIIQAFTLAQIEIPDKAWEINPYNALGYAALVIFMLLVNWFTYKTWKESENYARERDAKFIEFNTKIVELMIKIELKLNDTKELSHKLDNLIGETKDLYRSIIEVRNDLLTTIKDDHRRN